MAQIFPKWTNDIPRVGLPVLTVLGGLVTFAMWFWMSPKHTDVGRSCSGRRSMRTARA